MKNLKLAKPESISTFDTLTNFHSVLNQCRVLVPGDKTSPTISLTEGLERAVDMVRAVKRTHNKVVLIGNGGSAAIASHQSVDLWKNGGIRATAFNDASLLTCIANDFGYPQVFEKPIEMFCDEGDLLLAISSSGKSINILNAVEAARKMNCPIIGFSGFGADNPLYKAGDLNFYIPSSSYGIVEIGHLLLIHAVIDEVIKRQIAESTK
jgi:D-sedoheptulose 7-phosphate isomerase